MNRGGIASESNATRNGIRCDASRVRAPARANPTRPDLRSTPNPFPSPAIAGGKPPAPPERLEDGS